nr:aldehyde dehydrogenase (NADP(+)) [Allomuricauda sp.]
MILNGSNIIGFSDSRQSGESFYAVNPKTGQQLNTAHVQATISEVNTAAELAESAFQSYRKLSGMKKAKFLETIAEEIENLGDSLIEICMQETALPEARLKGERGRTVGQLRLFAQLLQEGSWVDARIDFANPNRQPVPRPDTRQMQIALGPVGVFGASNFPLAFSVAGGDTASALAAGCTVVVKGHPAHPGTSELVGRAINQAVKKCNLPEGVFSLVQGPSIAVGQAIVRHSLIKAIGFTGSYRGGKALFDEANKRDEPIPVYAEMGSTNPVFILPEKLKQETPAIAQGLKNSIQLGVGQFCTNPGLTIVDGSETAKEFEQLLSKEVEDLVSATMLTSGIQSAYESGLQKFKDKTTVSSLSQGKKGDDETQGVPELLAVKGKDFLADSELEKEVFGPSTLLVQTEDDKELLQIAKNLEGHLTATVYGTENDLKANEELLAVLERKVGRLLINGYPTGVEVCHSMVHGGPFPATSDSRMTSVGTAAITRFTRPICYQNYPEFLLPEELKTDNPLKISRIINGERQ